MLTLSATSQKGGVAKTTTSLCMAFGLADKGYRVLAVDLDPQRNMSSTLLYDEALPTSLDVMANTVTLQEAVQRYRNFDFVSASPRGGKADEVLASAGRDHRLAKSLESVASSYDFCVVDTPPSLGTLTINALTACDWVVIPAMADVYSLDGINDLGSTIDSVRRYTNESLQIAGILLTRYNPRTNISQAIYEMAEQMAGFLSTRVFSATIREGVVVRESQALHEDLFTFAPKAKVTQDYRNFLEELLGVVNASKS